MLRVVRFRILKDSSCLYDTGIDKLKFLLLARLSMELSSTTSLKGNGEHMVRSSNLLRELHAVNMNEGESAIEWFLFLIAEQTEVVELHSRSPRNSSGTSLP